jgi:Predicted membrane protein
MDKMAEGFEVVGVVVLVIGLVWSLALAVVVWRRSGDGRAGYRALRETFGGVLLLGLEILVAADLIRTVAVAPTLENVSVLGLIVLIRTFLSFSLEIEIEGVPPWRRAAASGAGRIAQAATRHRVGTADDA